MARFCKNKNKGKKSLKHPFKPDIDKQSNKLARKIRSIGKELHEHFREKYAKCIRKIDDLRVLKNDKEARDCTFQPQINEKASKAKERNPIFYY